MDRRTVLSRAGAAALAGLAGCTSLQGSDDTTTTTPAPTTTQPSYETYAFDHGDVEKPLLSGGLSHGGEGTETKREAWLFVDQAGTGMFRESLLKDVDADAHAFVTETDLREAVLLVYQEFPASSSPDYEVTDLVRDGDALDVTISDASSGGTADRTVETVLVRVSHPWADEPKSATITTEDGAEVETGVERSGA